MCLMVNNERTDTKGLGLFTEGLLEASERPVHRRFLKAHDFPALPVLFQEAGVRKITPMTWGLIPAWVKDDARALELKRMTLNCKFETMFELPSFRDSARSKRCLIPISSFYEYQHLDKMGQPDPKGKATKLFEISWEGRESFCLAGLWAENRGQRTFTLVTMPANALMRGIHNAKLRQPVFVAEERAELWLTGSQSDLEGWAVPSDELPLLAKEIEKSTVRTGELF